MPVSARRRAMRLKLQQLGAEAQWAMNHKDYDQADQLIGQMQRVIADFNRKEWEHGRR